MASGGYPDDYQKGKKITGLEEAGQLEDVVVFHAGTKEENGQIVTSGGRVLGVTALGNTIADAKAQAYKAVDKINFDGAYCRRDIADKAIKAN
jgi:phosphoribosylamine--glycine ligase